MVALMLLLAACSESWDFSYPYLALKGQTPAGFAGWSVDGGGTFDGTGPSLLVGQPSLVLADIPYSYGGDVVYAATDFTSAQDLGTPVAAASAATDHPGTGLYLAGGQDYNGDGYDDLIASEPFYYQECVDSAAYCLPTTLPGAACFVLGGPDPGFTGCWVLDGVNEVLNAAPPSWLGDVNADGYADFSLSYSGGVFVDLGNAEGWFLSPTIFYDPTPYGATDIPLGLGDGQAVGVGDLDGDGRNDLAIGTPWDGDGIGSVRIVLSTLFPERVVNQDAALVDVFGATAWTLPGPADRPWSAFGVRLASGADVTGDGVADLVVHAPSYPDENGDIVGAVFIYEMPRSGGTPDAEPWAVVTGTAQWSLTQPIDLGRQEADALASGAILTMGRITASVNALDLNEGMVTLVRFPESGFMGGTATVDDLDHQDLLGSDRQHAFGMSVSGDSDLDGDGRTDVAVGVPGDEAWGVPGGGSVMVYFARDLW